MSGVLKVRGESHALRSLASISALRRQEIQAALRSSTPERHRRVFCVLLGHMWPRLNALTIALERANSGDIYASGEAVASALLDQGYSLAEIDDFVAQAALALQPTSEASTVAGAPAPPPAAVPEEEPEPVPGLKLHGQTWAEFLPMMTGQSTGKTTLARHKAWSDATKAYRGGDLKSWLAEHGEAHKAEFDPPGV